MTHNLLILLFTECNYEAGVYKVEISWRPSYCAGLLFIFIFAHRDKGYQNMTCDANIRGVGRQASGEGQRGTAVGYLSSSCRLTALPSAPKVRRYCAACCICLAVLKG